MGRLADEVRRLEFVQSDLATAQRTNDVLRFDLAEAKRERDKLSSEVTRLRGELNDRPPRLILMRVHIVKDGDTLTSIAKLHDLGEGGVGDLVTLNRLNNADHIEPGWFLMIPGTLRDER